MRANSFEETSRRPYWVNYQTSGFHLYTAFPDFQMIPNSTVVVVLTDGEVCSAGETFIGNLYQVENVIFVGENSTGCTTFWGKALFRLPHSLLPVILPTSLHFAPDLKIHEEEGFSPDLWVPAGQCLDVVVKALKKKIIVSAPSPKHFLEEGLEKKERGELREALKDLIIAYSWLGTNLEPTGVLSKEGGTDFTFQDLKKESVFLCLHFIKNGDEAVKSGDYESALENFASVNKHWRAFYTLSVSYVDSGDYQLYSDVGIIYTPSIVEEKIRLCVEELKEEAEILKDQGHLGESKEKYAFIVTKLTEADWNNEDIEECKSEMARIETLTAQRTQIVVLIVIGLVIGSLIAVRFKFKK